MPIAKVTRRKLLIGATGTAAVAGSGGLWLVMDRVNDMRHRKPVARDAVFAPSAYLSIDTDGRIVVWVTRSEMGQGISTGLPMLVAEELDADWRDISIEQAVASSDVDYGQLFTAASSSIAGEFHMFRRAGATARAMLLSAAAQDMAVSEKDCLVSNSTITHPSSGQSRTFGEVAELAASQWAPVRPDLKNPADFKLIGTAVTRLDLKDKVTGQSVYGLDVRLPDMLYAVVSRPPHFGAKLQSFDDGQSRRVKGVVDVKQIASGVAVVAQSSYAALQGRKALQTSWSEAPADALSSNQLSSNLTAALDETAQFIEAAGSASANAAELQKYSARYEVPYLAHACMEPMNCTAKVTDTVCEVWAPTQAPQGARRTAAAISGLPIDQVRVNVTQLGGGFGRRAADDFIRETVELAAQIDQPVQVFWSREDDIAHASYRDAATHKLTALVDPSSSQPVDWSHQIVSAQAGRHQGDSMPFTARMGSADLPYNFSHTSLGWSSVRAPLPLQIWRSVGYSYNTFAVESFVNELAAQANTDPVEYRLGLLADNPRLTRCLKEVAALSNWQPGTRHLGVATHNFGNTQVAMVVEVSGENLADLRVDKVWCVIDCGIAVNTDSVAAQIESGIVDGLSAALHGQISFTENAVEQSNFHNYPLLRIDEAPDIEVRIVPSTVYPSGIGEASLPGVAPALTGAIHHMTGQWIRTLPIALLLKRQVA
ncbi:MAG: molybdopterin-dependent oxidoreductase [Pseudomonadaceae bacterium]|nr:molybdopterin-dependent oxidoreductase [Pseudomonadaceae bacterium]